MDYTSIREITKIARETQKFVTMELRNTGLCGNDYEFIHYVRHHQGCSQNEVAIFLNLDKSAISRKTEALIQKGYISKQTNPKDRRAQLLFPTEEAQQVKRISVEIESAYYQYLIEHCAISEKEMESFLEVLEKLYQTSKQERKTGFAHVRQDT